MPLRFFNVGLDIVAGNKIPCSAYQFSHFFTHPISMIESVAKVLLTVKFLRVYLKSQKEEKDESNVEKKCYNKGRRK